MLSAEGEVIGTGWNVREAEGDPTGHAEVVKLLDRVRAALPGLEVRVGDGVWKGPVSAGIAELGPGVDTVKKLIQAATTRRWPLEPGVPA